MSLRGPQARGNLRTVGATTWAEYKKYIEKDPALTRRFQVVQVLEPDEAKAILMLRGVASILEKHHRVQLLDEAIEAATVIASMSLPSVIMAKECVNMAYEGSLNETLMYERRNFHALFSTEDQKEGMKAFVEKRAPAFVHR